MNDLPLIRRVSLTKKPIIISTGMSSLKEIENTYNAAKNYGIKDVSLLYCVSNYPSKNSDFNLNNIKIMKKKFKCEIGFQTILMILESHRQLLGLGQLLLKNILVLKI